MSGSLARQLLYSEEGSDAPETPFGEGGATCNKIIMRRFLALMESKAVNPAPETAQSAKTPEIDLKKFSLGTKLKFYICSIIGILFFFVEFTVNGSKSIPLALLGSFITGNFGTIIGYVSVLFALIGIVQVCMRPKFFFRNFTASFFTCCRIIGGVLIAFAVFNFGPEFLLQPTLLPSLKTNAIYSLVVYVIIATAMLPFVLKSGLVDFVGVLLRPIMRPVFKVPGRSVVIALTAYFGSAMVGIVTIDEEYKKGKFTTFEACALSTGWATMAISFMVILTRIGGMLNYWGWYLLTTTVVLAVLHIILCRIYPLSKLPNTTYENMPYEEEPVAKGNLLKLALFEAYSQSEKSSNIFKEMWLGVKSGCSVISGVAGSTMVLGTCGLLVFYFTPVFTWLGYLFWPFAFIARIPDIANVMQGAIACIAELVTPAIIAAGSAHFVTRLVLITLPITGIIGLTMTVPTFMNTKHIGALGFPKLMLMFWQRIGLSILVSAAMGWLYVLINGVPVL